MPLVNVQLIFVFLWIVAVSGAFFWLLRRRLPALPSLATAVAVAFLLRLLPALVLPRGAGYEMWLFQEVGKLLRAGGDVYTSELSLPYLPLQLYWFAAADWLAARVGLFFIFWLKLPAIVADSALVLLIYAAIRRRQSALEARHVAWLYALNPLTILVTAYQGQFDAIPLLFLLLAWYLLGEQERRYHLALSALALGVAVLSKTWPVLFLPIAFLRLPRWRDRIFYPLLVGLVPLSAILLYELRFPGSTLPLLRRAQYAGAISGWWGYSAPLNVLVTVSGRGAPLYEWLASAGKQFGRLAGLVTILLTWKRPALYSLLLSILVMFAFVPNLGLQSLCWVVPIALLWGERNRLGWYVLGVLLHMIVAYWGMHLNDTLYRLLPQLQANIILQLSALFAWLPILVWLVEEATGLSLFPRLFSLPRPQAHVVPSR